MTDITRILSASEQGDPSAAEQLLPLVYGEPWKLAAARMAQEKPGQTLQSTGQVHEAYLRVGVPQSVAGVFACHLTWQVRHERRAFWQRESIMVQSEGPATKLFVFESLAGVPPD